MRIGVVEVVVVTLSLGQFPAGTSRRRQDSGELKRLDIVLWAMVYLVVDLCSSP